MLSLGIPFLGIRDAMFEYKVDQIVVLQIIQQISRNVL